MTETISISGRFKFSRAAGAIAVAVIASAALPAPSAVALAAKSVVRLAPHRAVYDMVLDENSERGGIANVRGRMVFEFAGSSCEGYTLNIRLVTQLTNRSGATTTTDLRSSSWEQGAGKQFRFNSTHYQNEKLTESASGNALRDKSGEGLAVDLSKPKPAKLRFSGNILFPTQHSVEILASALKGGRIVQAKIFDGSEQGQKLYTTTAFIGKQRPAGFKKPPLAPVENDEILDAIVSWPVTISYFDSDEAGEATPAYEMSFQLYENGVSRGITIDYGDFAIRGTMKSLEFFTLPKCD